LPPAGIVPKKDGRGIVSTLSAPGAPGFPKEIAYVPDAGLVSRPLTPVLNSARLSAGNGRIASLTATKLKYPALSAGRSSGRASTGSSPRPAPVSVVRSYVNAERRDVYDLSVADVHEFTASGVIVHNCIWALIELSRRGGASYMEMYSFYPCHTCGENVNQVLDKQCRNCGAEIVVKEKEKVRDRATRWHYAYSRTCEYGHDRPVNMTACPECGTDPGLYLKQLAEFTGGGNRLPGYTGRNWLTGRRI
jgi:DNA-directed RNA polymerase subunit RPC12/RpoP